MPRVKQTEEQSKDDIVRGLLAKSQTIKKMKDEEVAEQLHITRQTYQRKKKFPRTFTLRELRRLAKVLNWTQEEFFNLM